MLDATNSTKDRRRLLVQRFHGQWQYLFIESICNDEVVRQSRWRKDRDRSTGEAGACRPSLFRPGGGDFDPQARIRAPLPIPPSPTPRRQVLRQNYELKMMYSPDYKGMDHDKAMEVRGGRGLNGSGGEAGEGEGAGEAGVLPAQRTAARADPRRASVLTAGSRPALPAPDSPQDFTARIRKYEAVYQTISDRSLHYIKLIDMVTGALCRDVPSSLNRGDGRVFLGACATGVPGRCMAPFSF